MKKQIVFDDKDIIHINRDALHREFRNVLAEENVPEEYRIYMEMLEDMFTVAKTADQLLKLLETETAQRPLLAQSIDRCRAGVSESDAILEKWEQFLLHHE